MSREFLFIVLGIAVVVSLAILSLASIGIVIVAWSARLPAWTKLLCSSQLSVSVVA